MSTANLLHTNRSRPVFRIAAITGIVMSMILFGVSFIAKPTVSPSPDTPSFHDLMQQGYYAWKERTASDSLPLYLHALPLSPDDAGRWTCFSNLGHCYSKSAMIEVFSDPREGTYDLLQAAHAWRQSALLQMTIPEQGNLNTDHAGQNDDQEFNEARENFARALYVAAHFGNSGQNDQQSDSTSDDSVADPDSEMMDEEQQSDDGNNQTDQPPEPDDSMQERDSATANIDPDSILEQEQQNNRFRQRNRELSRQTGEKDW